MAAVTICAACVLAGSRGRHAAAENQPVLPDPIVDMRRSAFAKWEALAKSADANGDAALTKAEWPAEKLAEAVPALTGVTFAACDRDRNGRVDRSEAERLFDVAYGLARPDGQRLRTPDGKALDWSYIRRLDKNGDGYLSRAEFVSHHFKGREKSAAMFIERDANHDDRLDDNEMEPIFWWDIPANFHGADKDKDGFLNDEEMTKSVGSWGKSLAQRTVTAFDDNGDGKLSLTEYRGSTFGNPFTQLHLPGRDIDDDGRLSFEEFYRESPPALLALYRHFFTHFDLDKDGVLSLAEFDITIDLAKMRPEVAFRAHDQNRDGKLVFAEVFVDRKPAGDAAATLRYQERLANSTDRFNDNDRDRSGFLDGEEFAAWQRAEAEARSANQRAYQQLEEAFAAQDKDRDGQLTLEELLAHQPENARPRLKQQFAVLDFDGSATLSRAEFGAAPGKLPLEKRGAVPDPIVELNAAALQKWRAISKAADGDGDGALNEREWPAAQLAEGIPALGDVTFAMFDRDRSGHVDRWEAEWLFDIAFGLLRRNGRRFRTAHGTVLDFTSIRILDANWDQQLTREEVASPFYEGPAKNAAIFTTHDVDGDGRLNNDEMAPIFSLDILSNFLDADKDMDGYLTGGELVPAVPNWGASLAATTVRAFDGDGDGKLSFAEYRSTSFANPLADFDRARQDTDHDGRLSFVEFYKEKPPFLLALYRHFFGHFDLDKDGFLALSEFRFDVDHHRVKPELAFAAKDLDGDGKLTFAEIFIERKPTHGDQRALDRYEMRLARAENRFRADDRDSSGYLDLDELTKSHQNAMDAARRHSKALSTRKTMLEGNYWVRKGVLVVNEIAFLAIVWMVVRRTGRR